MSEEVKWERSHYTSGQLAKETPYVNGQRHGIQKRWYSNGQLWWKLPWVNDQRHGIERGWHPNGQLRWETPYVNGMRHGIRKHWKEDGTLWSIEKFHRDQRLIDIEFNPIAGETKMELDLITNEMSYE
jgi:antitoxin component YwqK of YwqJK toxin-antitoxin module